MNKRSVVLIPAVLLVLAGCDGTVRVMSTGLGSGRIRSSPGGIDCTDSCSANFSRDATIRLMANPQTGSAFVRWSGDCSGTGRECVLTLNSYKSAVAEFAPIDTVPLLSDNLLTGQGVADFLNANWQRINSPARFIASLRASSHRFADNWILMTRSESLQTGTAPSPRVLLPSQNSRVIFSFSLTRSPGEFPHADPNKIEFMEFDEAANLFRFHEIDIGARTVTLNAGVCAQCHYGRPNWDAYDSWGGMLPYSRDRVYKGSLDAASLRNVLNLWGKAGDQRQILEQLNLPGNMYRETSGGPFNGHVYYRDLDAGVVVLIEPGSTEWAGPGQPLAAATARYPASDDPSTVQQAGAFFRLMPSRISDPDEGRGVDLFDQLTDLNARRIIQELSARPRVPVDVRPIALAIATGCTLEADPEVTESAAQRFFNKRNRASDFSSLDVDTRSRRRQLPVLKTALQLENMTAASGLIATYGSYARGGGSRSIGRVRQELFRRPAETEGFRQSALVPLAIDRETYDAQVTRYRYFLEPLGVPVDKWSMSVHGRSRTYTFADLLLNYDRAIISTLGPALGIPAREGACSSEARAAAHAQFRLLPALEAPVSYAEVQGILSRNCLECHGTVRSGGASYPPSLLPADSYNLLLLPAARRIVARDTIASRLFRRLKGDPSPMPPAANGPLLSGADIDVIRRWIMQGAPR